MKLTIEFSKDRDKENPPLSEIVWRYERCNEKVLSGHFPIQNFLKNPPKAPEKQPPEGRGTKNWDMGAVFDWLNKKDQEARVTQIHFKWLWGVPPKDPLQEMNVLGCCFDSWCRQNSIAYVHTKGINVAEVKGCPPGGLNNEASA